MSRTLALVILAVLGTWMCSPWRAAATAQAKPQDYPFCAECYDWKNTFDPARARAWDAQRVRVKLVGDLADQNGPALLAALDRMHEITGLEFEQVEQHVQLLVIDDTRAFESITSGLPRFQVTDLPSVLALLRYTIGQTETSSQPQACSSVHIDDRDGVTQAAILVVNGREANCAARDLKGVFGLHHFTLDDERDAYNLCLLYRSLRVGSRTAASMAKYADDNHGAC